MTDRERYATAMWDAGWLPWFDLFGGIYKWWHRNTSKEVVDSVAYNYWQMSGDTPIPF